MGSFFYFSGLPEVVKKFAALTNKDSDIKLLLIGGGEQEQELRSLVAELSLNDRVIFTGYAPYADLPRYLRLADVAINPLKISRVSSVAFPHKVLQYLASGLPVVSTRLDGLVSALEGIQNLDWVESPEDCLDRAIELIKNSDLTLGLDSNKKVLASLFAPAIALESLTNTLNLAVSGRTTK
jgi:glycosyltransferase involved in cell wall biosynthesis